MPNLVNDFEVRKETLRALGGNPDGLANIFEVDKEILKLIGSGGSGIDWDTIKQKLAEDGVESIKFNIQVPINTKKYIGFDEGALPFSTGHTITTNTRVQMKFRCLKGTDNSFIGMHMRDAYDNKNKWRFVRLGGDNAFQQICDVNVEHRCTLWNINPDNWYELEIGNCYIKDVQTGEILAQNTDTESGSWGELVLNACRGEKGDIAYVKLFEGDELVRNYIAAADEDGNIGFYESLSNTFTIAAGWQRSENDDWTSTYQVQGEVILTGDELKTLLNQTVLPDAPSDGKTYGRNNGTWTPVESGGSGIPDAPSDGKTYGRNNGTWTEVESGYPIKQGVAIDNNVVSVENYGQHTSLHGNFIEFLTDGISVRFYDKLEVTPTGEESKTAKFIDIVNSGNGVVKTSNNGNVKFWLGTQQEYDAIATKDANTLYIIK